MSIALTNAGFESSSGGWTLSSSGASFTPTAASGGSYEWGPPEGTGLAQLSANEAIEQTTAETATAETTYSLRVWARSTIAYLRQPGTPPTTIGRVTLSAGSSTASTEVSLTPKRLQGVAATSSSGTSAATRTLIFPPAAFD